MFHSLQPHFHNNENLYQQIYQSQLPQPQHPFPSPSPSPPSTSGYKRKLGQTSDSSYTRSRTAANLRERKRMQCINEAFEGLRKHIPTLPYEKRLSKVDTLRLAICYINFLSELISSGGEGQGEEGEGTGATEKRKNNGKVLIYNTTTFQEQPTEVGLPPLKGHSLSWSREVENTIEEVTEPQRKVKCVRTRRTWHPEAPNDIKKATFSNTFNTF